MFFLFLFYGTIWGMLLLVLLWNLVEFWAETIWSCSLFADDIIVYISDHKNSFKEVLKLINIFGNVAVYKINSKKSVAFLYTNDKWTENTIRETLLFTIATNNIKCLGVTLTKLVEDPYDKNFKSLKKEIEENGKISFSLG